MLMREKNKYKNVIARTNIYIYTVYYFYINRYMNNNFFFFTTIDLTDYTILVIKVYIIFIDRAANDLLNHITKTILHIIYVGQQYIS